MPSKPKNFPKAATTNYFQLLEVVDSGRSVLSIRLTLAELEGQQKVSLAALAQALGSGWSGK